MPLEVESPWEKKVFLRPGKNEDVPFITNSWLMSYRESPALWGVPDRVYKAAHHKVLEDVIPRSAVLVAHPEGSPDDIIGWCCYEVAHSTLILHYLYVKRLFRGNQVASNMLREVIRVEQSENVVITHRTKAGWKTAHHIFGENELNLPWILNPYVLYR